jgi:hypothetical protein
VVTTDTGGTDFTANNKTLCDPENARKVAAYRSAMNDLVNRRLLEVEWSRDGDLGLRLTKAGYELADQLGGAGAAEDDV